jgi:hypothetical protein
VIQQNLDGEQIACTKGNWGIDMELLIKPNIFPAHIFMINLFNPVTIYINQYHCHHHSQFTDLENGDTFL